MLFDIMIFFAVLIIAGILVFSLTSDVKTDLGTENSATTTNETIGPVNETGVMLYNSIQCGFQSLSVNTVINKTSNVALLSDNYTVSSAGLVKFASSNNAKGFNNSYWNVTYSYTYGGLGCNATIQAEEGELKIFNNLDLMALAAAFGVVLYLIFRVIPKNQIQF